MQMLAMLARTHGQRDASAADITASLAGLSVVDPPGAGSSTWNIAVVAAGLQSAAPELNADQVIICCTSDAHAQQS